MHALRPLLASVLLAVFAVGGVLVPAVHGAVHGLEQAAESAEHEAEHHADSGETPLAQAPCAPAPHEVDCAVCVGIHVAADLTSGPSVPPEAEREAYAARADHVRTQTASGSGARAPPVG